MKAVSHSFRVVSLSWAETIGIKREQQITKRQRHLLTGPPNEKASRNSLIECGIARKLYRHPLNRNREPNPLTGTGQRPPGEEFDSSQRQEQRISLLRRESIELISPPEGV